MKKAISLLLILILSFSLVACSEDVSKKDIEDMTNEEIYKEYIEPLNSSFIFHNNYYLNTMSDIFASTYLYNYNNFIEIDKEYYLENYELASYEEFFSYSDILKVPADVIENGLRNKFILEEDFFSEYKNENENGLSDFYYININQSRETAGGKLVDKESINLEKTSEGYTINFTYLKPINYYESEKGAPLIIEYFYKLNLVKEDGIYKYNGISSKINFDSLSNLGVNYLYLSELSELILVGGDFTVSDLVTDDMQVNGFSYSAIIRTVNNLLYSQKHYHIIYDNFNKLDAFIKEYEKYFGEETAEILREKIKQDINYNAELDEFNYHLSSLSSQNYYNAQVMDFNIDGDIMTINYNLNLWDGEEGVYKFDSKGQLTILLKEYGYNILSNKML